MTHGITWDAIVHSNILNFMIVVGLIVWLVNKFQVGATLSKQQDKIAEDLKAAEALHQQAAKELEQASLKAQQLQTEIETIRQQAQVNAEQLAQSIVANAEQDAQTLLENARKRIALEEANAAREVEKRLMHDALNAAKALLENTLTPQDKIQTVETFLDELPQLVKPS